MVLCLLNYSPESERRINAGGERLRIWLGRTGVFQVIERNRMEEIMNEVLGGSAGNALEIAEAMRYLGTGHARAKLVVDI